MHPISILDFQVSTEQPQTSNACNTIDSLRMSISTAAAAARSSNNAAQAHDTLIGTNHDGMSSSMTTVGTKRKYEAKNKLDATQSNSSELECNWEVTPREEKAWNHTPVLSADRLEFTRQWIKPFISSVVATTLEQRQLLLKSVLCDTKVGEENVLMKLQLDYEFDSGFTVLALILYYFCIDPVVTDPSHPRMIAKDPKRSGFTIALLNNLRLYGYVVFSSFDWIRLSAVADRPNDKIGREGNILSLLLVVLERGRWTTPGTIEFISQEESEFIQWIEEVIRVILEQPTLTTEIKSKFLNQEFNPAGGWLDKTNPLGIITTHGNCYVSVARLLILHGANINASENGSPSPLMTACLHHHVELVLEMISSQSNLLTIALTQMYRGNQSILSAFTTKFDAYDSYSLDSVMPNTTESFRGVRCSTPIRLLKRIIRRLYQWQEEQKKELALNSNFQPNDMTIRQWFKEQLTSLPNVLFAATMLHYMHQPLTSNQPPDYQELCHRDYLRRWIHQVQTAPDSINLMEVSPNYQVKRTFIADSLDIFLEPEFGPFVSQLFSLLDDSHLSFVDGLILFGEQSGTYTLAHIFISIEPLLSYDKLIGEKGAYQQSFLLQLMNIIIHRLSHIIQVYQSESWKNNHDYLLQLRQTYGYDSTDTTHDHELRIVLSQSLKYINKQVPNILLDLAHTIGSTCSIEVCLALWLNSLPKLDYFRENEFTFCCGMLYRLIDATLKKPVHERPIERLQAFLTHPFFLTTDLFEPFQMYNFWLEVDSEQLNLVGVVKKLDAEKRKWIGTGFNDLTTIAHRQTIIDYIIQFESDWINIHLPTIRMNLEEYLVPDVAGIVFDMLQPSNPAPLTISKTPVSDFGLVFPPSISNTAYQVDSFSKSHFSSSTYSCTTSTLPTVDSSSMESSPPSACIENGELSPFHPYSIGSFNYAAHAHAPIIATDMTTNSTPINTTFSTSPTASITNDEHESHFIALSRTTDGFSFGAGVTDTPPTAPLTVGGFTFGDPAAASGGFSFGNVTASCNFSSPTTGEFSFGAVPDKTDDTNTPVTDGRFTLGVPLTPTDASVAVPITDGFTVGGSGASIGFSFGSVTPCSSTPTATDSSNN